ncbi:uncharacterized protein VTP21DRAFT_6769 [Calcarisporiella thermophila]|uniref:uncharacterized protein n=1 Tax=Calcarisporiella thermophila TaxID=911321 RepID=UPI003744956E
MEFMSNLGSASTDVYRPSLFELIAQDKMCELLQMAVRYGISIYAQRYPRLLLPLVNRHDEFYAILRLIIEWHYLNDWGASFAENFYGLKRVRSKAVKQMSEIVSQHRTLLSSSATIADQQKKQRREEKLRPRDIRWSLVFLVGLPYTKSKLDELYERISGGAGARLFGETFSPDEQEEEELLDPQTTARRRLLIQLKRVFRLVYPLINAAYNGLILIHYIGYLFNKTDYYQPWLKWIGIEIKRMSFADYLDRMMQKAQTAISITNPAASPSLIRWAFRGTMWTLSQTLDLLKVVLPMSIFFFKFLEWWYGSEFARTGLRGMGANGSATIPPPEPIKPDPEGTSLPSTPNTCPLCLKRPIVNPTALPSGYVFCFNCAFRHVEKHFTCPVTLMRIDGVDQLRKVM